MKHLPPLLALVAALALTIAACDTVEDLTPAETTDPPASKVEEVCKEFSGVSRGLCQAYYRNECDAPEPPDPSTCADLTVNWEKNSSEPAPWEDQILAIAYTDMDPADGDAYVEGVDVLIAELVDADESGDPSVGDVVKLGQYPVSLDNIVFAPYLLSELPVDAVHSASPADVVVCAGQWPGEEEGILHTFGWTKGTAEVLFAPFKPSSAGCPGINGTISLTIWDELTLDQDDKIWAVSPAPHLWDMEPQTLTKRSVQDDPHVDIEIRLPAPAAKQSVFDEAPALPEFTPDGRVVFPTK